MVKIDKLTKVMTIKQSNKWTERLTDRKMKIKSVI